MQIMKLPTLEIVAGSSINECLALYNDDGGVVDLTGRTISLSVFDYLHPSTTAVYVDGELNVSDGELTLGYVLLSISSVATASWSGKYIYQISFPGVEGSGDSEVMQGFIIAAPKGPVSVS